MLARKLLSFSIKYHRLNTVKHCLPATTIVQHRCLTTNAPKAAEPTKDKFLNYSEEESEKIINIINNSSWEELRRYPISMVGVNKLQSWKRKHGQLRSPKDLLEVEGFNVNTLQKFCSSLLRGEYKDNTTKAAKERSKNNAFLIPSLISEQKSKIRSSVALHIGTSSISWARLELPEEHEADHKKPCLLTDWQYHHFAVKKLHLENLVQKCLKFEQNIPAADCYIFENPKKAQVSSNPGSPDQININVEKAQMTAMLSYALAARQRSEAESETQANNEDVQELYSKVTTSAEEESDENKPLPNVFYMRNFLHARLFRNIIGSEQVSSEQTILNLMRTYYNDDTAPTTDKLTTEQRNIIRGNVQFNPEQRFLYNEAEGYQREFLGQALLLNLAFVRLMLLQDGESIRKVTRRHKKVKEEDEDQI